MYSKYKQRIKSIVLVVLILSCLLQLTLLWNIQGHGFPFFSKPSTPSFDFRKAASDEFFKPYRIVASEGSANPHWIVSKSFVEYSKLWDEAKSYLVDIFSTAEPAQVVDSKEWTNIVSSYYKTVIYEFKTSIDAGLVSWFLNTPEAPSKGPAGLYKMVISPEEEMNFDLISIYVHDGSKIYRYTFTIGPKRFTKDYYDLLFVQFRDNPHLNDYRVLKVLLGGYLNISEDVLGIIYEPRYSTYNSINCYVPEELAIYENKNSDKNEKIYTMGQIDKIAGIVLGSDKDSYDSSVDNGNAIEFKTLNDSYTIYNDGVILYNHLSSSTSDKGELKDSFVNAYKFLNRLKPLYTGVQLYLSNISSRDKTHYEFTFDYIFNDKDIPVWCSYKAAGRDDKPIANAFVIGANSKKVTACRGLLRNFSFNDDLVQLDLDINKIVIKDKKNVKINDICLSYEINSNLNSSKLNPVWVIKTSDGSYSKPVLRKR